MSFFIEMPSWVEKVYTLEINDTVSGGLEGAFNKPYQDLANRTYYLKTQIASHLHDQDHLSKTEQLTVLEGTCLHTGEAYYPMPGELPEEGEEINPLKIVMIIAYLNIHGVK
jgi:hypothetical protein